MNIIGLDFGNHSIKLYQLKNGYPEIILNPLGERSFPNHLVIRNNKRYLSSEVASNFSSLVIHNQFNTRDLIFSGNSSPELLKFMNLSLFQPPKFIHMMIIMFNYIRKHIPPNNCRLIINYCSTYSKFSRTKLITILEKLGFNMIDFVDDSLAICTNYCFNKNIDQEFCLTIDIGELDVRTSFNEITDHKLYILDRHVIKHIGGFYFNLEIIKWLKRKYSIDGGRIDAKLYPLSETIKKSLSMNTSYLLDEKITFNNEIFHFDIKVKREHFHSYFNTIWKKAIDNIIDHYKIRKVDKIILNGNLWRYPDLKSLCEKGWKDVPIEHSHLDEGVAKGNCMLGLLFSSPQPKLKIHDKIDYPIWIRINGLKELIVFKEDTSIPKTTTINLNNWNPNLKISFRSGNEKFHLSYVTQVPKKNIFNQVLKLTISIDRNKICKVMDINIGDNKIFTKNKLQIIDSNVDKLILVEKENYWDEMKLEEYLSIINNIEFYHLKNIKLIRDNYRIYQLKMASMNKEHLNQLIEKTKLIIDNAHNMLKVKHDDIHYANDILEQAKDIYNYLDPFFKRFYNV